MGTPQAIPWAGLGPMMPDMMLRVMCSHNRRVFYNTGYGHLGWTLSAATADAVAGMATGTSNAAYCYTINNRFGVGAPPMTRTLGVKSRRT